MTPYYEDNLVTIYHGDALDVLPRITSADAVVTDPPYTFGLGSTMRAGQKIGGWGDLMNNARWYASWLVECQRMTEHRQGSAWVFNSWRSFPVLARAADMVDWDIASLLVWDKEWIGPGGPRGLRPSYELVALLAHRDFKIENRSLPDIWRSQWSALKPNGHPAEKPVPLLSRIISESGAGSVVDPFCGSGSTLIAARMVGATAIGIEIDERWCEVAAQRCRQGTLELAI